ncbi:MAG: cytochrome c oxidase subunit 3 [Acidimicrobiales bacterium]
MATTEAQLALPSGEKSPDTSTTVYGVIALGVSGVVVLGALLGAWASLRSSTPVWPPKGFKFEEYFGNTLAVTILMAALAAWWGAYGVVKRERRQAAAGFGLTIFLELAFINLLTYALRSSKLSPSANGFGVIYYALSGAAIAIAATGVVVAGVTVARVLGGQVDREAPSLGWAAAWYSTFVMVAWAVVYTAIYVVQ